MTACRVDGHVSIEDLHRVAQARRRSGREPRKSTRSPASRSRVDAGEMLGYVGPNGAGKSTTIKMLTGMLVPSGGRGPGRRPRPVAAARRRSRARIGVVFGQRSQLWWDLPLRDSFELLRHIYRVAARRATASGSTSASSCWSSDAFINTPVRQLSLGQRMRGELDGRAAARPRDPVPGRADDRAGRREQGPHPRVPRRPQPRARHHGAAHHPRPRRHRAPVLAAADHRPRPRDLRRRPRGARATSTATSARSSSTSPRADRAARRAAAEVVKVDGPRQWLRFRRDDTTAAELIADVAARYPLRDLTIEEPAIEDIVRRIYTGGIALDASAAGSIPAADSTPSASGDQPASSP